MQPTLKPTVKQDEAWQLIQDNSLPFIYLLFGGGAGGGKSWFGCEWLLVMCYFYPGTRWFIGREELKRLRDSTLITFWKVCKHHNIPQTDYKYNGQDNYILFNNGSRIDLLDLRYFPSDPLYERYGSVEYTGGWIEEGGEVNFDAFDTLKSRVGRQLNGMYGLNQKILITCNPKKNWLYPTFYKPWKDGTLESGYAFVQALVTDNDYREPGYEQSLESIKDKAKKERLLHGNWEYDDDPLSLVDEYDSIMDIFNNNHPPVGKKFISCDAARFGSDKAIIFVWQGFTVIDYAVFDISKTTDISKKIKEFQKKYRIHNSATIVDADGVGGGVVDEVGCVGFVNNSAPFKLKGNDNYDNLKSQCGFMLADKINEGEISWKAKLAEKEREEMIEEFEQLKRQDSDTKKKLITKDLIKSNIARSPDYLDTFIMRMYFELKPGKVKMKGMTV
jgi:phage terminase large subunit